MPAPDLRALEIFRAVAIEGSVSQAAIKLNRVQSNISTRLKQLEQQLGKRLFDRRHRRLTLTADGHLLLSYAERLLRLSAEAAEALNGGLPSGVFRIGTMESTAAARLPAILARYHALYPDVRIEVHTDTAGGLMRRLLSHEIEVAFAAEPVDFERVATRPVFAERLILIAPPSFPPLDDTRILSGKTVVAFETGCAYRRYLDQWLLESGIVPGGVMAVGSYLAIFACVAAGTGFAVVPQSVLDVVATEAGFRRFALSDRYASIKTLLVWRADDVSARRAALDQLLPGGPAATESRQMIAAAL